MLTTISKFNLPAALVGEHYVPVLPLQMGNPRHNFCFIAWKSTLQNIQKDVLAWRRLEHKNNHNRSNGWGRTKEIGASEKGRKAASPCGHFGSDMQIFVLWISFCKAWDFSVTFVELKTRDSSEKDHGHRTRDAKQHAIQTGGKKAV